MLVSAPTPARCFARSSSYWAAGMRRSKRCWTRSSWWREATTGLVEVSAPAAALGLDANPSADAVRSAAQGAVHRVREVPDRVMPDEAAARDDAEREEIIDLLDPNLLPLQLLIDRIGSLGPAIHSRRNAVTSAITTPPRRRGPEGGQQPQPGQGDYHAEVSPPRRAARQQQPQRHAQGRGPQTDGRGGRADRLHPRGPRRRRTAGPRKRPSCAPASGIGAWTSRGSRRPGRSAGSCTACRCGGTSWCATRCWTGRAASSSARRTTGCGPRWRCSTACCSLAAAWP